MLYFIIYIIGIFVFYFTIHSDEDGECAQEMVTTVSLVWPIALLCFCILEVRRWLRKMFKDVDIE